MQTNSGQEIKDYDVDDTPKRSWECSLKFSDTTATIFLKTHKVKLSYMNVTSQPTVTAVGFDLTSLYLAKQVMSTQ